MPLIKDLKMYLTIYFAKPTEVWISWSILVFDTDQFLDTIHNSVYNASILPVDSDAEKQNKTKQKTEKNQKQTNKQTKKQTNKQTKKTFVVL